MYGKPAIKPTCKIYRLRRSRARILAVAFNLFLAGFCLVVAYIYWLNFRITGRFPEIYIIGLIGFPTVWSVWLTIQTYFRVRLAIAPDISEFRGMGYNVQFKWEDVEEVAYVPSQYAHYQLTLFLSKPYKVSRGIGSPYHTMIVSPYMIPLDILYSSQRWQAARPSAKEAQIFYDYFMTTPLGQDILRYAPHAYSSRLHRYLVDEQDQDNES
jgi:hypothetical protein